MNSNHGSDLETANEFEIELRFKIFDSFSQKLRYALSNANLDYSIKEVHDALKYYGYTEDEVIEALITTDNDIANRQYM